MDFSKVIAAVIGDLDRAGVRYALIGGFAMGLRGVQRATHDLDFILMLDDLPKADVALSALGYQRVFHSENVSHYVSTKSEWGRIDILHAFRTPSVSMLARAERLALNEELTIPVVQIEDLIGLKLQALGNDTSRTVGDWHDIQLLLQSAKRRGVVVDWELLGSYLQALEMTDKLPQLKDIYGAADQG